MYYNKLYYKTYNSVTVFSNSGTVTAYNAKEII